MSKLNPQNATAYVGPGVLRKGGKITPVPNGPLIKKKGPFKGSTLKAGGKIKKAQNGESFTKDNKGYTYTKQVTKPEGKRSYQGKSIDQATAMKIANFKIRNNPSDSLRRVKPIVKKNGGKTKKAFFGSSMFKDNAIYKKTTDLRGKIGSSALGIPGMKPIVKNGKMIKRADGSTSKRGLWDNLRANKGSGKKPTAAMLKQERKIKAKK